MALRLAIWRIMVGEAKFRLLEVQDLNVAHLHAGEVIVSEAFHMPGRNLHPGRNGYASESPISRK